MTLPFSSARFGGLRNALGALAASGLSLVLTSPSLAQQRLPETLVTADRFVAAADELPWGQSVISAQDIERSGVSTVNEALIKLLGVAGRQDAYGGGNYALDLRGFGAAAQSNQVLVVDGIKINDADQSVARLAAIPIGTVQRIEVLRGSGAVLYGEGATGGVIVITTQGGEGRARQNAAAVSTTVGSLGLRQALASATLAAGGFSADVALQQRDADNHRENFRSENQATSVLAQWSNDWLRLGARHSQDDLHTGLPGALTALQYAQRPQQAQTPRNYADLGQNAQSVFAQAVLGGWQIALDADQRFKDLLSYFAGSAFAPSSFYSYQVRASSASVRAKYDQKVGDRAYALLLGFDQARWSRNLTSATSVVEQSNAGFYVKNELLLANGLLLSAGWRGDDVRKKVVGTASRVSETPQAWEATAAYPFTPVFSGYTRLGRSYRLANLDELGFTAPGAALRPQQSQDAELGLRAQAPEGQLEVRWYQHQLRDEIGYDPQAIGPYSAWGSNGANVNLSPTRRRGLELEGWYDLRADWRLQLNAAWREAQFVQGRYAGKNLALAPDQTLALHLNWRFAPGQYVNSSVNWVAAQYPDFANSCRMPAYTTVGLQYGYQWPRAALWLGVNNLTNRQYYTLAYQCAAGAPTAVYPEAGRTLAASVRWRF